MDNSTDPSYPQPIFETQRCAFDQYLGCNGIFSRCFLAPDMGIIWSCYESVYGVLVRIGRLGGVCNGIGLVLCNKDQGEPKVSHKTRHGFTKMLIVSAAQFQTGLER